MNQKVKTRLMENRLKDYTRTRTQFTKKKLKNLKKVAKIIKKLYKQKKESL